MTIQLSKPAIDVGIVTNNPDAMLEFYRDFLGMPEDCRLPFSYGGTVYKLRCGQMMLKIVAPTEPVTKESESGLMAAATGIRYLTIWINNLEEIMRRCVDSGVTILVPHLSPRPGVAVGIVEDPDGNTVEFAQQESPEPD